MQPVSFQVLLRLGAGGMGEVHLALMRSAQGQQIVALKRLHRELLSDPSVVGRFEREAKICALLSHPLIVGLHGHGCDERGPWLALEYVHGRSASLLIKEWKSRTGALPLPVALSICHDAAEALRCAHSLPVIHRDLSPDNVLVAYTGEAKLTDFGIAQMTDGSARLTRTGFVPGKAGFMSPEVLSGEPGTTASDVFALAATFYRVLTGVRAFNGNSEVEVLQAVLNAQPPRLSALRPEVPAGIAQWIDAGLSKLPADRPQELAGLCELITAELGSPSAARAATAECMNTAFPAETDAHRSELKEVIDRTATHRPPASSTSEAPRDPRLYSWRLVAAGAVLLAALSAAGLVFWLPQRDAQPQPPENARSGADRGPGLAPPQLGPVPPVLSAFALADAGPSLGLAAWPLPAADAGPSVGPPELAAVPLTGTDAAPPGPRGAPAPAVVRAAAPVPAPVRAPPRPAASKRKPGKLLARSEPSVVVFVDGEYRGPAPIKVELPAGEHTVLFSHPALQRAHSQKIEVRPGETRLVSHRFSPIDGGRAP